MSTSKTKSKAGKASQVTNGTLDHKNQPTAEQLRIASMAADKTDIDPEMLKKIKEVSDLTGRTTDEAYTALHDCNGDANRAVDLLFEKDNHQDEWHEMKKKRKPTAANRAQAEAAQNQAVERSADNWENSEGQVESGRGRRERGPPRYGRGTGRGAGRGSLNGASNSRERTGDKLGASDRAYDTTRGRRRGAGAGRPGGRNFKEKDHSVEPAHQNIELWSNSIAENGKEAESWNNNDEWTNADAWDGSLEESLVLTRSVPAANHQSSPMTGGNFAVNSVTPGSDAAHHLPQQTAYQMNDSGNGQPQPQHYSHQLQQSGQQQGAPYNISDVQHLSQSHHHIGQQQHQNKDLGLSASARGFNVMSSLGQSMPDTYSTQVPNSSAVYLSHYAKEATECIKNAVGIGSSSSPGRNIGSAPLNAAPLIQQLDRSKPQQHLKAKVPSKIPQSAVEMPGSMSSMQLDVQFGNWDAPNNIGLISSNNQSELIQDKQQSVNLQQFMTGSLPPTVASLSKLHMQNAHDGGSIHLKPTVEDMMTAGRADERRLHGSGQAVSESAGVGSNVGPAGGPLAGSNTGYQTSAAGEVTSGKVSFPPTSEDRKSHTFTQQQSSTGYGQIQSSSSAQIEKSLLTSSFQNQAEPQGLSLGSLGLASSLNNTQPVISCAQTTTSSVIAGSHSGHVVTDSPQTASNPQHPHHLASTQLQYPYNLVRGGDGVANNSSAYMYNHQFSSKNYASEKQPSSLVFDGTTNASNLYHQSSYHMPSSAYPGSSGMYLGGSSSYIPTSNVGSFHNSGSGAYQSGNLGSGSGEHPTQAQPSFHHHHPSSSSNYPSASLAGDSVFHNQSGHLFRNTSFRSTMEQESFQREGNVGGNVGAGSSQPSSSMSSGITMASAPNKLASDLSKLGLKESASTSSTVSSVAGNNQFDQTSSMISVASLTTATNTTSSANLSTSVTSTSPSVGMTKSSNSQLSINAKSATQTTTGKHMMNYQSNVNLLNTNYMISQPPGFQLAPFGYQHSQQALTGYAYEDMQAQHFNVGGSYVDIPFQMTNALQGRSGQQMSAQSQTFGGSDTKLTPLEPTQPGGSLQPQQPATGSASQQFHPYSGFNYYIPGTGLMPYIPVMPMSGMAVPMPTNPALQASVPSSQYQQKPGVYGSQHAFNMGGGQSQDFTKGFNQSQTTLAKSANGNTQASSHGDMLLASGSGFNKQHVQGFDKSGFHGGTPPSSFGLNVPGGTQTGTPGAGPAIYSGPFMPVMGHPSHSQILHHTMVAQEMSLGNRGGSSGQQKVGPNKSYNTAYWSSGN